MPLRPLASKSLWRAAASASASSPRPSIPTSTSTSTSMLRLAQHRRGLMTVPRCPEPTCECAETPEMPEGLPLDKEGKLNGLISSYAEQVLICTGHNGWASKIEDDNSGDNLAADLKELIGRGGTYSDPFHNISVLNSSFPPSVSRRPEVLNASAYLLPSFKYVPFLPRVSFDAVQALVRGHLLPERLHPAHAGLPPIHRDRLLRKPAYASLLPGVRDVDEVLVLICGHGGRDARCGVMGPVLQAEFERQLSRPGALHGIEVARGAPVDESAPPPPLSGTNTTTTRARVGQISHIGGHKFAGNVIVYLPPGLRTSAGSEHPLAGHGVWYGRVEPRHVEGIVAETIGKGSIVADHFRGAIKPNREILRLSLRAAATQQQTQQQANYHATRPRRAPADRQAETTTTTTPNRDPRPGQDGKTRRGSRPPGRGWLWVAAGATTAVAGSWYGFYYDPGRRQRGVLNASTFTAFTVAAKERVSPTAFILTLDLQQQQQQQSRSPSSPAAGDNARVIREAWRHGLWSVEAMQPQLQIARHYTPLPPLPMSPASGGGGGGGDEESAPVRLRLLVRTVDRGEMSTYLSKLGVGDAVNLRGPHHGFDGARRLGLGDDDAAAAAQAQGEEDDGGHCQRRRRVVFLAGGTGIAPALQMAHRLLEGAPAPAAAGSSSGGDDDRHAAGGDGPGAASVTILWANRHADDALARPEAQRPGRQPGGWWRWPWTTTTTTTETSAGPDGSLLMSASDSHSDSLSAQIRALARRHPGRLDVRYFVDEEGSRIGAGDVRSALLLGGSGCSLGEGHAASVNSDCVWHSQSAVERLPNDDDTARSSRSNRSSSSSSSKGRNTSKEGGAEAEEEVCWCAPRDDGRRGRDLVCVSGPDGFVEALAGPKRWAAGGEMQGPVGGVLGRLGVSGGGGGGGRGGLGDWLVLKI